MLDIATYVDNIRIICPDWNRVSQLVHQYILFTLSWLICVHICSIVFSIIELHCLVCCYKLIIFRKHTRRHSESFIVSKLFSIITL
ncbi:hypothetical protein PMAYCL1PPCAC_08448 [Pristionchus mayeri]|uniref:Uncharacterized protein n=1 Tax=Pristionchus mayeri TaxID=1317129 RepID=A0AAN5C5J5_9BILA|nr:hypothetical protein PMAYCL1PPCAC_08448 [Pristionchus mayeri]